MSNKIVHIQLRIEENLRNEFNKKCKEKDINGSQFLRGKIKEFLKELK